MGCIWAKFRLNPRRFFAGTIFTAAIGYLFKAYTARLLGADALGIYALGMTATGLASEIAGVGLCQGASKFVAAYAATGEVRKLQAFLWRGAGWLALLHVAIGTFLIIGRKVIATQLYRAPEIAQNMSYFVSLMFLGAFTSFFGQALVGYKNIARRTIITNFIPPRTVVKQGTNFRRETSFKQKPPSTKTAALTATVFSWSTQ